MGELARQCEVQRVKLSSDLGGMWTPLFAKPTCCAFAKGALTVKCGAVVMESRAGRQAGCKIACANCKPGANLMVN